MTYAPTLWPSGGGACPARGKGEELVGARGWNCSFVRYFILLLFYFFRLSLLSGVFDIVDVSIERK